MGELVIKNHDFENAKKELKKFSEQIITELDIKRVDDSKDLEEFLKDLFCGRGIGLNHKVSGKELNELTSEINLHLIDIKNTQIKLIREFGQVYSALEALDKDYIQAILISIKATEETSQGIKEKQRQIDKIVENQRKTLEELKKFKLKFEGYAHIEDIDKIWNDCQKWYKEINTLSNAINGAKDSSKECEKRDEDLVASIQKNKDKVDKNIAAEVQATNDAIESLSKKVKYAYWIAGGSAGLALIELILLLVKVI